MPQVAMCKMCLKDYIKDTNSVCCSDKCRIENRRQSKRRSWHKHKPNRYQDGVIANLKAQIAEMKNKRKNKKGTK